jgi:predicted DCC family thiol-disulfide oxidoreductase YuxK
MHTLTVLYDARCNLCSRVRSWLETQPAYVQLDFIAAGSAEARRRYPGLDHAATTRELTVISDAGDIYLEANAWIMCMWALRDYRAWSLRLSTPEMLPLARRIVLWVALNRFRFGTRTLNEILADDEALSVECADECSLG